MDTARFPAIRLAQHAMSLGNGGATVLNCTNEAAVAAFIAGRCGFLDISWIVETVLNRFAAGNMVSIACDTLEEIAYLDSHGRDMAADAIKAAATRRGGRAG